MHALTVDLEEWFHGIELDEGDWPTTSRLQEGLTPLLRLLDDHEVRATFFVLGVVAEQFPRTVSAIADAGHEIGCHGHRHRFVYRQSPDDFVDDLSRARQSIAQAVGYTPRGYRAPYFSIRDDSRWALDAVAELGFSYDSSIFPVWNYRYGMPQADVQPHVVSTPAGPLKEVPVTPVRVAGVNFPFSGGAYLRILPWAVQAAAWRLAEHHRMNVVAYIHPWELDSAHPRIQLPRRVSLTHYARLRLTHRRLDALLSRYRFGRLDHAFQV